ncbi:MAG: circadian clock protein KaiB [Caldilineaceae bacterium]|nr:circadian clock protein KaiB [Caldilineaceae bacterium]
MNKLELVLYVSSASARSKQAVGYLQRLCDMLEPATYEFTVVDVLEQPARAAEEGILVTPLLVRLAPPPKRYLAGDLSDVERIAALLDVAIARPETVQR